jgi:predicted O-methyltransferase YrrM
MFTLGYTSVRPCDISRTAKRIFMKFDMTYAILSISYNRDYHHDSSSNLRQGTAILRDDVITNGPRAVGIYKSRMRWARHLERKREMRNTYKNFVVKCQGKRPCGRP